MAQVLLSDHLAELGILHRQEERFCERKWRLDFYLTEFRIGIEIQGGIWTGGRHARGAGYQNDCDKANTATMMGIRLLRFTTEDVMKGRAKQFLGEWIKL